MRVLIFCLILSTALTASARIGEKCSDEEIIQENAPTQTELNILADYDWWKSANLQDVEVALSKGADVDAKNEKWEGMTPLMFALKAKCDIDVVELLVERGGDINARAESGMSPVLFALCEGCSLDVLNRLVGLGADVHIKGFGNNNAISLAMYDCKTDVIWRLFEMGVNVNYEGGAGGTALMKAAGYGELDKVRLLVEKCGADVCAVDKYGKTAYDHAKEGCNTIDPEIRRRCEQAMGYFRARARGY